MAVLPYCQATKSPRAGACLLWKISRPALLRGPELPGLAPGLGEQAHAVDDDVLLHGLAHVVDGQRRHRGRGEGLHLHTSRAVLWLSNRS